MKTIKATLVLFVFLGFILWAPLKNYAQKTIQVGVVFSTDIPYYKELHKRFIKILNNQFPDIHVNVIVQTPNPNPLAWSNAIRKLLVYDSQILIVYGSGALKAAIHEDVDVPIIFAGAFKTKLNNIRGKKLSGVFYKIHLSSVIRYIKKIRQTRHLDILFSEIEPSSIQEANMLKSLCKDFKINCSLHGVSDYDELSDYVDNVRADMVFVAESALIARFLPEFHEEFNKKLIPLVTTTPGLERITVFSLKPDIRYEAKSLAEIFVNVIKKRKGSNKIQTISKTTLTFNMGLAKILETMIPAELTSYADEVIK